MTVVFSMLALVDVIEGQLLDLNHQQKRKVLWSDFIGIKHELSQVEWQSDMIFVLSQVEWQPDWTSVNKSS